MNRIISAAATVFALSGAAFLAACEDRSAGDAPAGRQFVTIGTGGVTGVYYPTGGAICRHVNRERERHGVRCTVESTGGSVYNINAMRSGELDLGIVQSDWQYHAMRGTSQFQAAGPFEGLRAVFALHSEAFTVVARRDANVKTFTDLKGKRVNVGNPGSGQRATVDVLLEAMGWTVKDFAAATELRPAEQSQALCDGKVDAIIYVVGHPNGAIQEATTACDTVVVAVEGAAVDKLVADNPYYAKTAIPGGMYRGSAEPVTTFGVKATLVATTRTSADVIYEVVKGVFDNFAEFKELHPAFTLLEPPQLVKEGNSAPLHEGAERYFREKGML